MAINRVTHPIRDSAILTDENGRKWRIYGHVASGKGSFNITLEPDHSNCDNRRECKHYGETYL